MINDKNTLLPIRDSAVIQRNYLFIVLFWTITIIVFAGFTAHMEKEKTFNLTLNHARSYFHILVTTRFWNALHGGVYCAVNENTRPNPYLDVPDRDVTTLGGKNLTLINPAYMTRQISEIASKKDKIQFHITSLKPIRPKNTADTWETMALKSFTPTHNEFYGLIPNGKDSEQFRYMAPLWTEPPCLKCHARQGYKTGDLRGGISVSIPVHDDLAGLAATRVKLFLGFTIIWFLGACGTFTSYRIISKDSRTQSRLIGDLQKSLEEIRTLKGFIPICASCKKIRNDSGYWEQIEKYISERTSAEFSHGMCPDCMEKFYPGYTSKRKKEQTIT